MEWHHCLNQDFLPNFDHIIYIYTKIHVQQLAKTVDINQIYTKI